MPRVRFSHDFNWRVKDSVTISYKADHEYVVPQACADAAVSAGSAIKIGGETDVRPTRKGTEPWRAT